MGLEGFGLTEALSWNLPGRTEENNENLGQNVPAEIQTEHVYSVTAMPSAR
jgi:hypothetical protein